MRRPPKSLDEFLSGGSETLGGPSEAPAVTPTAEPATLPTSTTATAVPDPMAKDVSGRTDTEVRTTPTKKASPNRRAPKKSTQKKSPTKPAPKEADSAVRSTSQSIPGSNVDTGADNADEWEEERRSRTVAGEAARTVTMSVRVPVELRERLEDIVAAYAGVTFSDLVIRGLEEMVVKAEDRYRQTMGQDLPQRGQRPELRL